MTYNWRKNYLLAKQYYNQNNNLLIPQTYEIDGIRLGNWISNLRQNYKNNKLTAEQIDALNEIGMVWDINDFNFRNNYEIAKSYYEEHGNLLVPATYEVNGIKLGSWINNLRQNYKNNKLTAEQIDALNKIGMVWSINDFNFNNYYELAKSYYEEHGNLLIPTTYEVNGIKLGNWINSLRQAYKNNKLTAEQIDILNKIEMVWNISDFNFNNNYELAKSYYEEHGNLKVPPSYEVNDFKLGNWISNLRRYYKNQSLTTEQIDALNKIGMVWNINDFNFNTYYELAKSYYEEHKNLLVPVSYEVNGIKLGNWISSLRRYYKNEKLTVEQIDALNKIGMVWNISNFNFNNYYELARSYYEEHGDLLVPATYEVNGIKLGRWVGGLRHDYKSNNLSVDYVQKVTNIGMIWDKRQIVTINKIREYINTNNQKLILETMNSIIFYCLEDSLTSTMSYINNDISLYDLKQKSKMINSIMKKRLPSIDYQISALYSCGLTLDEISKIYKVSTKEIEKVRLKSYKIILKSLEEEPLNMEKEKSYSKKLI